MRLGSSLSKSFHKGFAHPSELGEPSPPRFAAAAGSQCQALCAGLEGSRSEAAAGVVEALGWDGI